MRTASTAANATSGTSFRRRCRRSSIARSAQLDRRPRASFTTAFQPMPGAVRAPAAPSPSRRFAARGGPPGRTDKSITWPTRCSSMPPTRRKPGSWWCAATEGRRIRLRVREPQAAARQYLSRQGHPGRTVAPGGLRRIWRQPPRLPRLQRNPSRLLPDPGRRPAGAARGRGRSPARGRAGRGAPRSRGRGRRRPRPRRRAEGAPAEATPDGQRRRGRGRDADDAETPARRDARRARRRRPRPSARRRRRRSRRRRGSEPRTSVDAETRRSRPPRPERRRRRSSTRTTRTTDVEEARDRRAARRRRRARGAARAPRAARAAVQDPGSHQAPPDPAGPGRQGRARQQGRGADHLSVARRPLFGADAEHRPRRRHLPQDHQRGRPQAPEGGRPGSRRAGGHGRHPAHRRRHPHQARDQARLRISDAAVGERPRADAEARPPLPSSTRKAR